MTESEHKEFGMYNVKWNNRTGSLEGEQFPFDATVLHRDKVTGDGSSDFSLGSYTTPSDKIAIITSVKYISDASSFFEISNAVEDDFYLSGAGTGIESGDINDPVLTLNPDEQIDFTIPNSTSDQVYAVVVKGIERPALFRGYGVLG